MTTSVLTASTILDDFTCSCNHDGAAADTLRMIRRIWNGALPNAAAAAEFILEELQWSSVYGNGGALGGTPQILKILSNTTINDSGANFYAVNVDLSGMTLTSVNNAYGIKVLGKAGIDAGIYVSGASTSGVSISGAATQQLLLTSTVAEKALTVTSTAQTVTPVTITSDSAISSAAYITALTSELRATVASAVNMIEANQFILLSAVQMGNWANAISAKIDMTTTGYVTGLAGVVCADLRMPSTNPAGSAGTYTCFEGELGIPNAYTSDVPVSFMNLNVWGIGGASGVAYFDTNGALFEVNGVTVNSGKLFQVNNNIATHALRIKVNGTPYYMLLSDTSD
jgi:hypothetical protein